MAAMHLRNAIHNSSIRSHFRILVEITADYRGFRAEFRAKTEPRLTPLTLAVDRSSNAAESDRARDGVRGHSAVQRMCQTPPQ